MKVQQQLRPTLERAGQSVTHARQVVFEALHVSEPLTIGELILKCPTINRASVYRTIQLFERLGIVVRLQTGWKYRLELSDDFHDHHHHATCNMCGRTVVLAEDTEMENHLQILSKRAQFVLENHQIELSGVCKNCALKS